ncbi:ead/Ea22-like family protein [Siccibacter turicensis]|uniref:ead/Ea22-like family protein n=1 Tax=Siccibacter turicensis TaxID=357233 RepID=UPI003F5734ED
MTNTNELTAKLKAAAEQATPGEWVYLPKNTSIEYEYDYVSEDSQGSVTYMKSGGLTQKQTDLNGNFIALANPANVLALIEALEAALRANAAQDDHINQQQDRIDQLEKGHNEAAKHIHSWRRLAKQNIAEREKDIAALTDARQRIAELEARTLTVKLPPRVDSSNVPFAAHSWNACLDEVEQYLIRAGIKLQIEGE